MKMNSFNPVARAYSRKVAPFRFSQFLTLVHELELRGDEVVLDIGSGPGELSMRIADELTNGGYLTGVDLSPNMVRLARKTAANYNRSNVSFTRGDALNLKFPDNSFDVVVSSNAFPWVSNRQRFLKEIYRVLKPGGRLGLVALSNRCYHEFANALKKVSAAHPKLLSIKNPFEQMGAKLHSLTGLGRTVTKSGLDVTKRFQFSTEEPITATDYLTRVNAIVNENYLDNLENESRRSRARTKIYEMLAESNDKLRVTESSIFVFAEKKRLALQA